MSAPGAWLAWMAKRVARRKVPGILESKRLHVNEGLPTNDIALQQRECDTCRMHCHT
ncbi:protein of unknown function [Thauera humireducens]|nr:protein of unknown function [Thauera humireducens]